MDSNRRCRMATAIATFSTSLLLLILAWNLFPASDQRLLDETLNNYFGSLSDSGNYGFKRSDCRLMEPPVSEKQLGAYKLGLCELELSNKTIHFMVGLSRSARFVFGTRYEVEKVDEPTR